MPSGPGSPPRGNRGRTLSIDHPLVASAAGAPEDAPEVLGVLTDGRTTLVGDIPEPVLSRTARASLRDWLASGDGPAEPGQAGELPLPGKRPARILAAAAGDCGTDALRLAGAALARAATGTSATVVVPTLTGAPASALVEGLVLGGYRFSARSGDRPGRWRITVVGPPAEAVVRGTTIASAVCWARDLGNIRTSTKTPSWLAGQAVSGLSPLGVAVTVHDERWLAAHGFGGVLAVGGGSSAPPRLIEAAWRPPGTGGGDHLVLVGKGITFDTGGYQLKGGAAMADMYTDMAGGAAVLGAMRAIAALRLPIRVTAMVPAAENSVSGTAMRPDDVVRHPGGRTTEVRNTDAEGRLVLADALGYVAAALHPTAIVDVATLTGAVKVALGLRVAGMFATDDALADALHAAARATAEPVWRMPFVDEYAGQLDSDIADANNAPGNPGAITAAMFLRPFTHGLPWAHLDVAGSARSSSDSGVVSRGATGFGVRLLTRWVEDRVRS